MTIDVRAEGLTKQYTSYASFHAGVKALLLNPRTYLFGHRDAGFVAIDDVSFEVARGECFGVIGRNGAGKSTLLGLVSGILRPSAGSVEVRGRVCPLLELGVGFAPDLTGRENIFLNGILLGLRRAEVVARLDRIIEFSGLESFIDQPLKTYSSGMRLRLGFSVACHSDPQVMLADEVLAVGDAEFHDRCLKRIAELRHDGVTFLLVSHDLVTIETICDRAMWIDGGRSVAVGDPVDVIGAYRESVDVHATKAVRTRELLARRPMGATR